MSDPRKDATVILANLRSQQEGWIRTDDTHRFMAAVRLMNLDELRELLALSLIGGGRLDLRDG